MAALSPAHRVKYLELAERWIELERQEVRLTLIYIASYFNPFNLFEGEIQTNWRWVVLVYPDNVGIFGCNRMKSKHQSLERGDRQNVGM